jgi:hypothetical protein
VAIPDVPQIVSWESSRLRPCTKNLGEGEAVRYVRFGVLVGVAVAVLSVFPIAALADAPAPPIPPGAYPAPPPPLGSPSPVVNGVTLAGLSCYPTFSFQNGGNGDWVSAELGYQEPWTGMLRARSSTIGPWEKWNWCYDSSTGKWSIQSNANGLWTSTEIGYTNEHHAMLRARSSTIGSWEQYTVYCVFGHGFFAFWANANGLYVSAELGYTGTDYGMLRARSASVGAWESFSSFPSC